MTESESESENQSEKTGTFVVTHVEDDCAIVRDVETAQVHTLSSNPDLEVHEVLEATLAPEPPLEVAWEIHDLEHRRSIDLVDSDLEPTQHAKAIAADAAVGDLVTEERAGTGEIHVFCLPGEQVDEAATDVLEDEETVARAARLEAVRVEVRRSAADDVLSVRYLPD